MPTVRTLAPIERTGGSVMSDPTRINTRRQFAGVRFVNRDTGGGVDVCMVRGFF